MKGLKILFVFFVFLNLYAHVITVDGDPSDWMTHSVTQRDTFFYLLHPGYTQDPYEAVWVDEINDDLGDGDYTYPTDPVFTGKEADLIEFRFTEGATSTDTFLYFLVIVGDTFGGGSDWGSFIGAFTIDTAKILTGAKYTPQFSDILVKGNWIYSAVLSMWWMKFFDQNYNDMSGRYVFAVQNNVFEGAVRIDSLSLYHRRYFVSFSVGLEDQGNYREVDSLESQYQGGGGINDWADPDVYDLAFIKSLNQASELSNYSINQPDTVKNAIKDVFLYVGVKEKVKIDIPTLKVKQGIYDITGRKVKFLRKGRIYFNIHGDKRKKILIIK